MIPKVVAFDIDETLTESKQPLTPAMAGLLSRLLAVTKVAIVSGGKYEIFKTQIFGQLPPDSNFANLYSLPTSGAALYRYEGTDFVPVYEELLTAEEGDRIRQAIEEAIAETGLIDMALPSYGERIEFRGSQVTLSALGQTAPIDEKKAWDPDRVKRPVLRETIAKRIPEFDVRTGGATSFDITRPGINKAFGILKLSEYLSIPIADMLYIGDALFPGGNDEVVKETGIRTIQVDGPDHTARVIEELLNS